MKESITYLRMKRQNLIDGEHWGDYEQLFRLMSPVPTLFWTTPGEPPIIQYRTDRDDRTENNNLRSDRTIIKGRFRGGSIGYIFADELPLFMAAYKKDISVYSDIDMTVLKILRSEGPMNIDMIKEITGLLSKHISASLQKLQKAFIVFEDQVDGEWDRSWYILEDEFSHLDLNAYTKEQAVEEILRRFAFLNVFADESMIKSFTRFSNRDIKRAISSLEEKGIFKGKVVSGVKGFILSGDEDEIATCAGTVPDKTFVLDLNDYLVRSNEAALKNRFNPEPFKILHYIMKRGEFIGIVAGRFSFGPNELENVILDVSDFDKNEFRNEIEKAIGKVYPTYDTQLKRYCSQHRF
ncbi:hypothetical protein [Spirochaeta isovalerica]|uniref:Winged helix DNA-binding domain-containing protein n=1 Tax=Spirochaeta isovalerica TaxID=150 RepID=A0A841RFJ5_9SPIO|nr:hypothetical protein [Spirochaeta isovalerica]MBB6481760.1 hypothetical protein [Spirochaeta isovalerica]